MTDSWPNFWKLMEWRKNIWIHRLNRSVQLWRFDTHRIQKKQKSRRYLARPTLLRACACSRTLLVRKETRATLVTLRSWTHLPQHHKAGKICFLRWEHCRGPTTSLDLDSIIVGLGLCSTGRVFPLSFTGNISWVMRGVLVWVPGAELDDSRGVLHNVVQRRYLPDGGDTVVNNLYLRGQFRGISRQFCWRRSFVNTYDDVS